MNISYKTKYLMAFALSAAIIGFTQSPILAKKPKTPASLKGAKIVSAKWVKKNHKKIKVYDVRKKAEYVEAHIPGALSAPYKEKSAKKAGFDMSKDKLNLNKFPSGKKTSVILYCNGPRCWKSYKASKTLIKAGYKKVYWFRTGIPAWRAKGYPVK